MKCAIFLAGEFYGGVPDVGGKTVVCCDRAYLYLKERGIKPDVVCGDFDSLGFVPEGAIVYPVEKDKTDFELAAEYAVNNGFSEADVYCGGGGREDHLLANFGVMLKAFRDGLKIRFITDYTISFVASEGTVLLEGLKGKTVSLVPLFDAGIACSTGLKYECDGIDLTFGSSRGISNVVISDDACFTVSSGTVLVFIVTGNIANEID